MKPRAPWASEPRRTTTPAVSLTCSRKQRKTSPPWVWAGIAFLVLVRRVFPHLEGEIAGPSTELVGLLLIATTLTLMIGGRDAIRALDYLPPKAAVVPESGKRRSGRPSENPN